MSVLVWLVPIALLMGAIGLAAFFWSLKSGQYEDLSGAAERILLAEDDQPIASPATTDQRLNKNTQPENQPATGADKRRI
jgi:cbb3-type cytochrome oxidase maturation protein